MVPDAPGASLLLTLVSMVDRLPEPATPVPQGRGRRPTYSDRLFLKALVIMVVRHLHSVHELLTVLEQPTPLMQALRLQLSQDGRLPSGAPSSADWPLCPRPCPPASVVWGDTWCP